MVKGTYLAFSDWPSVGSGTKIWETVFNPILVIGGRLLQKLLCNVLDCFFWVFCLSCLLFCCGFVGLFVGFFGLAFCGILVPWLEIEPEASAVKPGVWPQGMLPRLLLEIVVWLQTSQQSDVWQAGFLNSLLSIKGLVSWWVCCRLWVRILFLHRAWPLSVSVFSFSFPSQL